MLGGSIQWVGQTTIVAGTAVVDGGSNRQLFDKNEQRSGYNQVQSQTFRNSTAE